MGNALEKTADFTADAYLEWEAKETERHEYVNGEVFAMTGATTAHNAISLNFAATLKSALRGQPCRVYMEGVKLRVEAANCYFYPDVMVTCSPRDRAEPLAQSEPSVVVEVLSESTAEYDLGHKFDAYRQIPSLCEYVVVAQDRPHVSVYRRGEGVEWILHPYGADDALHLPSLDLVIPVAALYEDIEFGA
ncbi:MAG: Uma2 family endonuclease [Betaproteobacteria bacterium]|nr:Uma2 family endonuclease [Betaproteobacteria bacterium]